jgi:ribonuclease P protein component
VLSRKNRFHSRKSINSVYKFGDNFVLNNISLRRIKRKTDYPTRVAVVVSKKINKSAVVRNRIRRRIYEITRILEPNLNSRYDIVINVYNESVSEMKFEDLSENIKDLFIKAGCITETK